MKWLSTLKGYAQYLLPKTFMTYCAGWLADIKTPWFKNFIIVNFIKLYGVNMREALEENPKAYINFNDFFIRHLKPDARPLAHADILMPVDGCISEIGEIQQGQIFQAKGHDYSVETLLGQDPSFELFQSGKFATLYLAPKDYHRIHLPLNAQLTHPVYIPGQLFSVNPDSVSTIPNLFARNKRLVLFFDTEVGPMAMILVGATIVGAIGTVAHGEIPASAGLTRQTFTDKAFKKAEELGYFKLGSTVIVLFAEKEAMHWNPGLVAKTSILLGQTLGNFS